MFAFCPAEFETLPRRGALSSLLYLGSCEPPVKKLKAAGMPRCANCTLMAVTGMSEGACKRARHAV